MNNKQSAEVFTAQPRNEEAMNICASPTTIGTAGIRRKQDEGFTLIEILIAIVLVGILSAVAVVGISNLVSKGTSSACGTSKDAATAASAVYFASNGSYPATLAALVGNGLTLPAGVSTNATATTGPTPPAAAVGMQTTGASWFLTMTTAGTATAPPVFGCS